MQFHGYGAAAFDLSSLKPRLQDCVLPPYRPSVLVSSRIDDACPIFVLPQLFMAFHLTQKAILHRLSLFTFVKRIRPKYEVSVG